MARPAARHGLPSKITGFGGWGGHDRPPGTASPRTLLDLATPRPPACHAAPACPPPRAALAVVSVSANDKLCTLEGLPTGGALTSLEAARCGLTDLAPLAGCGSLARLDVSGNQGLAPEDYLGVGRINVNGWMVAPARVRLNAGLTTLSGLHGCSGLTVGAGRGQECGGVHSHQICSCKSARRQAWGGNGR